MAVIVWVQGGIALIRFTSQLRDSCLPLAGGAGLLQDVGGVRGPGGMAGVGWWGETELEEEACLLRTVLEFPSCPCLQWGICEWVAS